MCSAFGGVTPDILFSDLLIALAVAWMSCSLGVLASTFCRSGADAIAAAILLQAFWYSLPLVDWFLGDALSPIPDLVWGCNPLGRVFAGPPPGPSPWWYVQGLPLATTILFVVFSLALASWLLEPCWRRNPTFRKGPQAHRQESFYQRKQRGKPSRRVWDDPLLWHRLTHPAVRYVVPFFWGFFVVSALIMVLIMLSWAPSVRATRSGGYPLSVISAPAVTGIHQVLIAVAFAAAGVRLLGREPQRPQIEPLLMTDLGQVDFLRAHAIAVFVLVSPCTIVPFCFAAAPLFTGWSTWFCFAAIVVHNLVFWSFSLALGLVIGIRLSGIVKRTVVLESTLMPLIFLPIIPVFFGSTRPGGVFPAILTISPMFQPLALMMADKLRGDGWLGLSATEWRFSAISSTTMYMLATYALALWLRRPAGPWRPLKRNDEVR